VRDSTRAEWKQARRRERVLKRCISRSTSSTTMMSTSVWSIWTIASAWRVRGVSVIARSDLAAKRCWVKLSRPRSLSLASIARRPGASIRRGRARRRHSSTIHDTGNRSARAAHTSPTIGSPWLPRVQLVRLDADLVRSRGGSCRLPLRDTNCCLLGSRNHRHTPSR